MRPSEQLEAMRRLLAQHDDPTRGPPPRTTALDIARYLDPAELQAELQALFRRLPIAIAHESQLAEPGSFVTCELAGTPLVVVRTADAIAVHINACRHRGARLLGKSEGRCKAFICPYHAWSYRLDGELFHIPGRESFDALPQLHLATVPHEVRHGMVWVALDAETLDVSAFLGPTLDADFAAFALDTHDVRAQTQRDIPANWKLVMDAFAEGYHLKSLHRDTLSRFFLDVALLDDCSPHVRQVGARKTLVENRSLPESQWSFRRDTTVFYNLFPNTILVFHPHWVSWLTLLPRSVDSVRVLHRALVPRDAPNDDTTRARLEKSFAHIDSGVFEREDFAIAQSIQSTLGSGANDTVLLGSREEGMRLFHAARDRALTRA